MNKAIRVLLPIGSVVALLLLGWLSFQVAHRDFPDRPTNFAVGMALGTLIMPVLFSFVAGFVKRSFSEDKRYDWRMFHIFLISFSFLTLIGKYAELYGEPKEKQEQTEQPAE
ncbi:MAG: hypothetical protein R2792_18970 [Saprospiraceae bacterium]